ncbi:VOC family protein [uncultured Brevundimonas sp.]|uniref:VOC family protein n=1 Tax=uncultured Brevundimonas sp. TaxID=213418 RepID=UPI0030EEBAC6|tara:strand:+ start:1789 stop:2169 length:381 start_codon:yes stop_codon:yes gene_type:complete
MFTHMTVGANDIEASRKFYDAALGALGVAPSTADDKGRYWWRTARGAFAITKPLDGEPACHANGGTIGFAAADPAAVAAFQIAGVATGGTAIEDPPGPREGAFGTLHLAYLRDPSGNKICALHRVG